MRYTLQGEHRYTYGNAQITENHGPAIVKYEIEGPIEDRKKVVEWIEHAFPHQGWGTTLTYEGNDLTRMQRNARL